MAQENVELQTCQRCGQQSSTFMNVDTGTRVALESNKEIGRLPEQVCVSCFNSLAGAVSQGVKLRLEQQAKEKNRQMLWKTRVNVVKHARQMMAQKAYSEAAVSYEKYLRILEISYDLKSGEINPSVFGKTNRSKELTVIATTYWDLLRIYDTSPKYRDRMVVAARKLAEFLPFSKIQPDVAKKAAVFAGSAKNPDIVREFLKKANIRTGRCFIATAAYEDANHPEVMALRQWRDSSLRHHRFGRAFIAFYYKNSKPVAKFLNEHPQFKPLARAGLSSFVRLIKKQ
jgi:hypothetical protein